MTEEEITLYAIKGQIAELPEETQAQIQECSNRMRLLVEEYGPSALMAIALLGAELAASE